MQESIYLLDFQRIEVQSHLSVNLSIYVCLSCAFNVLAIYQSSTLLVHLCLVLMFTFKLSFTDKRRCTAYSAALYYIMHHSPSAHLLSSLASPPRQHCQGNTFGFMKLCALIITELKILSAASRSNQSRPVHP